MEHNEESKAVVAAKKPLVRTWVDLGGRVAERAVYSSIAAAKDVHGEWKDRLRSTLELVRKLSGHFDVFVDEVIDATEEGLLGVVRSTRHTANEAANVAARAGDTLIGDATDTAA